MTCVLFGIKNCDTVRKARRWLDAHGTMYRFHDLRSDGLGPGLLHDWVSELGWETLLNRRGTSWRHLTPEQQVAVDEARAVALMLAHPTLIKRPVLHFDGQYLIGFDAREYTQLFFSG